jgi:MEDS: MEthanogen/methylotroph, DcmR Sensory domain
MWVSTTQSSGPFGQPATSLADWEATLAAPKPGQHIAQLYTEHEFLARAVGRFIADGLANGEGVLVVATPLHWRVIGRRLGSLGVNVQTFLQRRQLAVRDAHEILSEVLAEDGPERERFRGVVGGALDGFTAAGYASTRVFGEMVDILRHSDLAGTLQLEDLWKELLAERRFTLLCGYSIDAFDPHSYRGLVQHVTAAHSDLVPAEDYARLDRAVERAYTEVFGSYEDARALREAFLQHFTRPAAMPDAQAAMLALREFVPGSADELVASVRRHYYALPA